MERHSPEPVPTPTLEMLPAGCPPPTPAPCVEAFPGLDEPPVRIGDVPPNTPTPGTAIDR